MFHTVKACKGALGGVLLRYVTARGGVSKGLVMRVNLDDIVTVECSHLLGRDVNGWVTPVFTSNQLATALDLVIAQGWAKYTADGVVVDTESETPIVRDLGHGEFVLGDGWVWDVSEWDTCEDCGQAVTPVAGCYGLSECGC